ncbi:MAG: HAD family hydrolase [Oscillospiraceae bacterium]|nr:HAD family hydrolase [Oscillospiraceae bacterium]
MIKAVLFDLDGTLLPMDQDVFIKAFSGLLAKKMVALKGYDPKQFSTAIWTAIGRIVKNDGSRTNEQLWWDVYCSVMGQTGREDENIFLDFYTNEFQSVADVCGYDKMAAEIIALVKEKGLRPVLATNPLFPQIATASRIRWAGMQPEDFELFTTFEDYSYCKPNLKYYLEIMEKTGLAPEECVMVGNDVGEDMIAENLGMKVFLLTDCLINKADRDISVYPHGGFNELAQFIKEL